MLQYVGLNCQVNRGKQYMRYFAYLDPGTGSIIIQAIVGFGLGVIVVLRTHIGRFFGKLKGGRSSSDGADAKQKGGKSEKSED
jgi:hypothetical protein